MTHPWLSVLIPTYNGDKYLSSALNSIAIQKTDEIECIAIDDGSTDTTLSILNSYQDHFPLKILKQKRQNNWVANTNHALTIATGKYVGFLHQDDLWLQERLSVLKELTVQFPEITLFLHPSYYLDENGNFLGLWRCPLPALPQITKSDVMIEKLLIQNFISMPAPLFMRETALKVGGMEESTWYTADWDFWLKIAQCGDTLYYPKPLSGFRIHSTSQTVVRSSSTQDFQNQLDGVIEKHLRLWNVSDTRKQNTAKIAHFSVEVNTTLASALHGKSTNTFKLLIHFLLLGPVKGYQYLVNSRIGERIFARLLARLSSTQQNKET